MRVLAIDVGTVNVGWAWGLPGETPSYGVYNPPTVRKDIGWLCVDFRAFLMTKINSCEIKTVVYCSPILVYGNNWWTIRKCVSLGAQIEVTAYDLGITVEEGDEARVRKHFLAPHKVPRKSKEIKDAVMARCRALGWKPELDDEGDALALLDYTLAVKNSRLARELTLEAPR